jgi:hypothetical protein
MVDYIKENFAVWAKYQNRPMAEGWERFAERTVGIDDSGKVVYKNNEAAQVEDDGQVARELYQYDNSYGGIVFGDTGVRTRISVDSWDNLEAYDGSDSRIILSYAETPEDNEVAYYDIATGEWKLGTVPSLYPHNHDSRYVNTAGADSMEGPLTITAGLAVTGAGAYIADGLEVGTGDLYVTIGDLNLVEGDLIVAEGDLIATLGGLTVAAGATVDGGVDIPSGDLTVTSGKIEIAAGNINALDGDINSVAGNVVFGHGYKLLSKDDASGDVDLLQINAQNRIVLGNISYNTILFAGSADEFPWLYHHSVNDYVAPFDGLTDWTDGYIPVWNTSDNTFVKLDPSTIPDYPPEWDRTLDQGEYVYGYDGGADRALLGVTMDPAFQLGSSALSTIIEGKHVWITAIGAGYDVKLAAADDIELIAGNHIILEPTGGTIEVGGFLEFDAANLGIMMWDGSSSYTGVVMNSSAHLLIGDSSVALVNLRGDPTRPQYNGADLALLSDTGESGSDPDAIHLSEAQEFNEVASVTPVTADRILFEDQSDSWAKKYNSIGSLPFYTETEIDALFDDLVIGTYLPLIAGFDYPLTGDLYIGDPVNHYFDVGSSGASLCREEGKVCIGADWGANKLTVEGGAIEIHDEDAWLYGRYGDDPGILRHMIRTTSSGHIEVGDANVNSYTYFKGNKNYFDNACYFGGWLYSTNSYLSVASDLRMEESDILLYPVGGSAIRAYDSTPALVHLLSLDSDNTIVGNAGGSIVLDTIGSVRITGLASGIYMETSTDSYSSMFLLSSDALTVGNSNRELIFFGDEDRPRYGITDYLALYTDVTDMTGSYLPLTAGSSKPLTGDLYVHTAQYPSVYLRTGGDTNDYTLLRDFDVNTALLEKHTSASNAYLDISARPDSGTHASRVRIGRYTNTSASVLFEILKGDGTATIQHEFYGNSGTVNLCKVGGNVTIEKGNLYIDKETSPTIYLREGGVAANRLQIYTDGTGVSYVLGYSSANATINIDPMAASNSYVQFFRNVNTSGIRRMDLFPGDGSGTFQHRFDAGTGDVSLCQVGGQLIVGGNIYALGSGMPQITARNDNDATREVSMKMTGFGWSYITTKSPNAAVVNLEALPGDGTSGADYYLFRTTNTTGTKRLLIFEGDGTGTVQHEFNAGTGNVNLCKEGGNLTVTGGVKQWWAKFIGATPAPSAGEVMIGKNNHHSLEIQTEWGTMDLGPQNANWCQFNTSLSQYYFDKVASFVGGVRDYDGGNNRYIGRMNSDKMEIGDPAETLNLQGLGTRPVFKNAALALLTDVGGDDDAIHDNVSGEISLVTQKYSLVVADMFLIEDSQAGNAKKRITGTTMATFIETVIGAGIATNTIEPYSDETITVNADFFEVVGRVKMNELDHSDAGYIYCLSDIYFAKAATFGFSTAIDEQRDWASVNVDNRLELGNSVMSTEFVQTLYMKSGVAIRSYTTNYLSSHNLVSKDSNDDVVVGSGIGSSTLKLYSGEGKVKFYNGIDMQGNDIVMDGGAFTDAVDIDGNLQLGNYLQMEYEKNLNIKNSGGTPIGVMSVTDSWFRLGSNDLFTAIRGIVTGTSPGFPVGQWGIWKNSSGGQVWLCYNDGGSTKMVEMTTTPHAE